MINVFFKKYLECYNSFCCDCIRKCNFCNEDSCKICVKDYNQNKLLKIGIFLRSIN